MVDWNIWKVWHSYPLAVCPSCKQAEGIIQCDSDYFFSCRRCGGSAGGSMTGANFRTDEERAAFSRQKKMCRSYVNSHYPVKNRGELDHKEW